MHVIYIVLFWGSIRIEYSAARAFRSCLHIVTLVLLDNVIKEFKFLPCRRAYELM